MIGQDTLVQTLTNAISSNRIAHAYILTGVRGVGKTTTARLISRALNCEKMLINSFLSEQIIGKAKKILEKDFEPITDVRASKKYRMEVAKNLLEKCFLEIQKKENIRINN